MTKTLNFARRALRGSTALQALALVGAGAIASGVAAPAMAQDVTAGAISGIVRDDAGKAVAGAQVVLRSTDRGFERTVSTNAQGHFTAPALPIGPYEATISAPDYQSTRTDGIVSQLGGTSYNFTLAAASETDRDIVVTATVQRAIDFSSTATGQVFNVQETAATLPVARNITALQLLAPQAIPGDVNFNSANTSGVSLGGSSVAENIFYINGMNVTNFRTFVGGTTVPFEFYDSAVVKTGGYQAEFGRNTGGAVIAVTRSGTNEYRGGFNFYYTPDWARKDAPNTYNANNSLDQRTSMEGNIWASGPIIKDHLFFFGFFNPRNYFTQDVSRAESFNAAGTVSSGFRDNTLVKTFQTAPFYGGKIDLNVVDSQRLELTYFNDSTNVLTKQTALANNTTAINRSFSGGENLIGKYTGDFADWLTVSALYGRSTFNQTTAGSDDGIPYTLDGRSGTLVYIAGNPLGLIAAGRDRRENFRADIDLTFSLLGSHKVRFGGDYEKLRADASTSYSGGVFYRYFRTGASGATVNQVAVPANTDYVRARTYNSGGSFESKNTAFYIQDSWDVVPQLNLNLGVRYDKFENFNASGNRFTVLDNQIAPRLGFSYDVFNDRTTRFTGFFGRYFLPVAANTNIRLGGNESFLENFYRFSGSNLSNPTLGARIGGQNVLSDASNVDPRTLISQNLKPQYMDEFLLGLERQIGNRIKVSVTGVYRKLGAVLEDSDFRYSITAFCRTQAFVGCNGTTAPTGALSGTFPAAVNPSVNGATIGSGGYVLINPGRDVVVDADLQNNGTLTRLTIPAALTGLPKAQRDYKAMEFKFEREFDGKWSLAGSYVLASLVGNYEGGVKSDNGQADTGLTQDFDEPGWMDGSYGYLPNHRRHTLKLYGSYKPTERILLGFNGVLASPRKFGCIGTYPFNDGRAAVSSAASWYCSNPLATGLPLATGSTATLNNPGYTSPLLIGRGRSFDSNWLKQVDLSVQYRVPIEGLRGLTLRVDGFNVFNSHAGINYNALGDQETPTLSNPNYGKINAYQAPRSVRFGMSMDF